MHQHQRTTSLLAVAMSTFAAATLLTASRAQAQENISPIPQTQVALNIDSGLVVGALTQRGVIYSTIIRARNAPWMRLNFSAAELGGPQQDVAGDDTILRITSLLDGHSQTMNAMHLQQWRNTSAYFNGDAVQLEIIADPGAVPSHVAVNSAWIGTQTLDEPAIATICGATDDRVLSTDPRAARIFPVGCTGWLINDANHCFLTAGHCAGTSLTTIEFNVPASTSTGALVHPPPSSQYSVDSSSVQFTNGGVGNDWCYFGVFNNSTTGLSPAAAQGAWYTLASSAPAGSGQTLRITGYGTDSTPSTANQVQQTSTGPYSSLTGTQLQYRVDTTGGNSGSEVVMESTGLAMGIHTHGGCTSTGGNNSGTAIQHAGLQAALASPHGICIPLPPPNNDCISAALASDGANPFTTIAATTDGPDEPGACNFNGFTQISRDVWFKWLATCSGTATISLCGANYDAKMAIYPACPATSGTTLACNDNFCGNAPQVSFACTQNTLYRIRIGGTNNATGTGTMMISCAPAPPSCPADLTNDSQVNIDDLVALITAWGPCAGCAADINHSGNVDIDDLVALITAWGNCP